MKITFISDTHGLHNKITENLPGGDILIHTGDCTNRGLYREIDDFCKWFDGLENYTYKVFIAGNHDWGFQQDPISAAEILEKYPDLIYLEDTLATLILPNWEEGVSIYGSPWQPEFYNWAFNLPRNGKELEDKWEMIPEKADIVLTHGPAWGYVDQTTGGHYVTGEHLGCEKLVERLYETKPKIHACGHIHTGYGHKFDGNTHFINASVLNERYEYTQKPITIDIDIETNKLHNISPFK